jgi:two-component system, OmpR family, phosphate regulon sensor histidine kinase PhoR
MSPKRISYIAVGCLVLIFSIQAFIVYDYFTTTRAGIIREVDGIVQEAFRKELNQRHKVYRTILHEETFVTPPPSTGNNTTKYDSSKTIDFGDNVLGILDLAVNTEVSRLVPLNLYHLNTIIGTILQARNIHSDYLIQVLEPKTGKEWKLSKKLHGTSFLTVPSKTLFIDLNKQKSLQLVLVNPFGLIITRMALMLLCSLLLSIICLLAFRYLLQVLARQKQLVAFKNEFLGTIAHELKRPVSSLTFNLDCLNMIPSKDNRQHQELLVHASINATTELNDTINMIVALTKHEEGLLVLNKEPVNLNNLMEDLKCKFASYPAKKVEIQTDYELPDFSVSGDIQLLSQCFANLIDNAIKYSSQEVLIIITIRRNKQWVVVSIRDNGFGIPQEKLPMIFDKYTRAHPENRKINGFGIGLNYVKNIVEKHKGMVEVNSQPGEGSEFSILLPY